MPDAEGLYVVTRCMQTAFINFSLRNLTRSVRAMDTVCSVDVRNNEAYILEAVFLKMKKSVLTDWKAINALAVFMPIDVRSLVMKVFMLGN